MPEKPLLEVCLSPVLLPLYNLEDTIVVVIDIFRASSTICAALDNGARSVIPIATVEECLAIAQQRPDCITAGERDGKVIPGLAFGNSPLTYNASFIKGKTLALTTTNGTRLLHLAKGASKIVIGSFLNINALCQFLMERRQKTLLACAAWKDRVNMEDTLFAGAVAEKLQGAFKITCDSAKMAARLYRNAEGSIPIFNLLKESSHYQRLSAFGLQKDMAYCTTLNLHPVVPMYNGKELIPLKN